MRVVILGSGRGSNAEAILQAQQAGRLGRAKVVQIFADKPDAGILALGPRFGVPADFLDAAPYKTKLDGAAEQHYIAAILSCQPDLVVLAGFMRVLKMPFLSMFEGKIVNLHPSLLPSFPGLDGIGQAFRRGVKITGCTVHYVTAELDGRSTRFLIDSGATVTTISAETARDAGIAPSGSFPVLVDTANGTVTARRGTARSLRIGSIERRDLAVHISDRDGINVVGMNFLETLRGWGVEDGALVLRP